MDGVLPSRGVEQDLPVPGRLRVAPGGWLDPAQELRGLHALWTVATLGFAGTAIVLLGGGLQELACDGRVADGGGVIESEHGGKVQGVGAAGEGFLELPVGAQALEGGGQAPA